MTDTASAEAKAAEPANTEDAKLEQFGYTQKLDRSVGRLASFAIGFATISATTAVFTGFGAGYFTAGAPFVWTLLLAGAVFLVWVVIAADLTSKIPLRKPDGTVVGVLVALEDITARKQTEAERARAQDEYIQMQSGLLAELSTPLIPITQAVVVMPLIGSIVWLAAGRPQYGTVT